MSKYIICGIPCIITYYKFFLNCSMLFNFLHHQTITNKFNFLDLKQKSKYFLNK